MGNNIGIDLFTQKSEITASTPEIIIEITGLAQLNSFIGLDDTPTYYENGKFFKVEDNKIVYTDINWGDIKGKIEDNPELVKEIGDFIQEKTEQYTSETVTKAIKAHDVDVNAHQSIQFTIQDNYTALDNKIELNKIDSNTKFDQVNKRIDDNTEYITRVDNYSQEVNKKLEDLTLEVDVDIKGDINQLREDLTSTNQVVQDNYTTLDTKIDNTKSELDTKIDTVETNITKDIQDKYTALDTRISANTKDITDLTQTVQDDYKEINGHITDLYNKKVDKVEGKELSTNDFTDELKSKLENIEATAQVNIIESISVDGVPQTIDGNKNVDLHQPVYTLVKKDTPADTNAKEYNLTIDGTTTGVTIEIPKDVYIEKCTLKYVTAVDTPYTGAKVNDAYLQFDRANSAPIYTPIPELQIHAGQDITVDENNVISTVIPIPRKISELNNDNYTVTDENYVHTDNNFTDGYIGRIEDLEKTAVKNVEYNKTTQKITVTFGDKTTKILTLEELLTGASYDGETGNFTFTKANGEPVVVNTPKENFLSDVQYDGTTKIITFTMSSGATFEVNVSDLIDIYTVKSTNSVEMSIENGNEISSNVKVSTTDGNIISVKTDGVYAEHQDISHLATKTELTHSSSTLDEKINNTDFKLTSNINLLDKKIDDTKSELSGNITDLTTTVNENYTTLNTKIDTKQDIITDLDAIRSGAELGSTAIQNTDDCVHKAGAETIPGVKTFSGGKSGVYDNPSILIDNAVFSGNSNTTNFTGFYNHRKCLNDSNFVNTAGFIVNSDGSAKFMHRRGTTTGYGTIDDSYISFSKNKLIYSTDGKTANEKDILHSGNTKTINGESILGSGDITIKSAPDLDNTTITKNVNEELQAIGVKTKDGTTAYDWIGTTAEYEAGLTSGLITNTTRCYITDDEEETVGFIPLATTNNVGLVKPDGSTITIKDGVISSVGGGSTPTATADTLGIVKPDNDTLTIQDGVLSVSSSTLGKYLPLAGGTVTGQTTFNDKIVLHNSFIELDSATEYSDWGYNWQDGIGAGFSIRSANFHSGETKYKGAFLLWARQNTSKQYVLAGRCDGVLEWCDSEVLTTNTAYTKTEIDTKIGDIETVLDNIIAGN